MDLQQVNALDPWTAAAWVSGHLASGGRLQPLSVPGFVPESYEIAVAMFDRAARFRYARYKPAEVTYAIGKSAVAMGSPAFVLGYVAGAAINSTIQHRRAQQAAAPQWRDAAVSRVVVTSHRLLCEVVLPDGPQWRSFTYDTVTSMELAQSALTLTFPRAWPLRLTGVWAPWCREVIAHYGAVIWSGQRVSAAS